MGEFLASTWVAKRTLCERRYPRYFIPIGICSRSHSIILLPVKLSHVNGVKGYSNPRFWPKDAETIVGSISVLVTRSSDDDFAPHVALAEVVRDVERTLRAGIPSLDKVTIQVE